MPFLLPALVALPSDAVILFLGLGLSPVSAIRDDDADGVSSSRGGEEDTGGGHASSHRHCTYRHKRLEHLDGRDLAPGSRIGNVLFFFWRVCIP
jgi:hypothetical protein